MGTIKLTGTICMSEINELWANNPEFFNSFGTTALDASGRMLIAANWMVRGIHCYENTLMSPAKDSDGNMWLVVRNMNKNGALKFYKKEDIDHGYGFSIFGCYFNDDDRGDEEADDVVGTVEIEARFAKCADWMPSSEAMRCAGNPMAVAKLTESLGKKLGCTVSSRNNDGIWTIIVPGLYKFAAEEECRTWTLKDEHGVRNYSARTEKEASWVTRIMKRDDRCRMGRVDHGDEFRLSDLNRFLEKHKDDLARNRGQINNPNMKMTGPSMPGVDLDLWHFRIPKYGILFYTGKYEDGRKACMTFESDTESFVISACEDPLQAVIDCLRLRMDTGESTDDITVIYENDYDLKKYVTD